jgi:hypothetical protein
MQHVLDIANFRVIFPAFSNVVDFPDLVLQAFWDVGVTYLGDYDGPLLSDDPLQSALNYMTAHLLQLSVMAQSGITPGIVTNATVDKVAVSIAEPPVKNAWGWWLALTPYGAALWALLTVKGAGGFYVGGSFSRAGYRGPVGGFNF